GDPEERIMISTRGISRQLGILASMFLTSAVSTWSQSVDVTSQVDRASHGIQTLMGWFDQAKGLYKTTGWWNSGNVTTLLVDYSRVSGATQYIPILADIFVAAQNTNPGFLNKYYDDEGWWALAWADAYDLTGNKVYLSLAESIFEDMVGAWDNTCGGGIWWNKDRRNKNAIANELFLSVAAHL